MGFWLMPEPEAFLHAAVLAPRYDDLHAVVEMLKYAENSGIATGALEIASPLLGLGATKEIVEGFLKAAAPLPKQHRDLIAGAKLGYSATLERYGLENRIPYWKLNLVFYGPKKVVAAQWEAIQDRAAAVIKEARFEAGPILTDAKQAVAQRQIYAQTVGIPNLEFFAMGTRAAGHPPFSGHLWFSPVIPQTGEGVIEANRVYEEASRTIPALQDLPILNLRPFSLPAPFHERTFLFILGFPVLDDPEANKAIIGAFRELIRIGADHGWGEYRTPVIFQDQAMGVYSFNDNALLRLHETIKDAIDPQGILAPGRYGIWPKHLRGKRDE
jgi:4-cresol dehydrogenase (hydroxylating)